MAPLRRCNDTIFFKKTRLERSGKNNNDSYVTYTFSHYYCNTLEFEKQILQPLQKYLFHFQPLPERD